MHGRFRSDVQWLLLCWASQKGAVEDRSACDPHAAEKPHCGRCHFNQTVSPAYYLFDFNLSLVTPSSSKPMDCVQAHLRQIQINFCFTQCLFAPVIWNCKRYPLETNLDCRDNSKKQGEEESSFRITYSFWVCDHVKPEYKSQSFAVRSL